MRKFLTVIFITMTFVSCGQKRPPIDKDKERINNVCDTFMKMFVDGKTSEALELLKRNTVMTSSSIDTLEVTMANHINQYFPLYGKLLSSDFITERKIKDFIATRFYVLRFEKYYLKFGFTLYKTNTGWTVTNFKYDEELAELLQ
ncbi:MAG: hypothetical protein SFU21_04660 [Flavihumibacter sp.]|nr:hypothetical protein [Flavihumibacter sp.]